MSWYERREHLPWFMKNLDLQLPYVECGVLDGQHLDHVKSVWGGRCIGVDPYHHYADHAEYPDANNRAQAEFDGMFDEVSRRHEILRTDTFAASQTYADSSLGCVYLDDNHTYRHLMKEMEAWWPKIADGGVLSGHDFRAGLNHQKTWFAVCRAARDFSEKHKVALWHTADTEDWYILKRRYFQPDEILVVSNFFGDWPSCIRENHQAYCDSLGYTYAAYEEPPPAGYAGQWSKINAIKRAWDSHPEKKFIWWVDADLIFMNPLPIHYRAYDTFDLVSEAYYAKGSPSGTGTINTYWFGVQMIDKMRDALNRALSYTEYSHRYPHEEAALTMVTNARANDRVLLSDMRHFIADPYWSHYSSYCWAIHISSANGHNRSVMLSDCCAMSRVI